MKKYFKIIIDQYRIRERELFVLSLMKCLNVGFLDVNYSHRCFRM
jgi:hypothetical protein